MTRSVLVGLITLALLHPGARAADVALRDTPEVLSGRILSISDQTLRMRTGVADEAEIVELPWTRIRAVANTDEDTPDLSAHLAVGADVWRAHQRLARTDAPGASPLLERHADAYLGRPGPLSADIGYGLASCRYWMGDTPGATAAWLAAIAAGGTTTDPAAHFLTVDPGSGLAAELPPAFAGAEDAAAFLEWIEPLRAETGSDSRARAIIELYADAALTLAGDPEQLDELAIRHDGLRLQLVREFGRDTAIMTLADTVGAVAGNAETREEARSRMRALIARRPPDWTAAWSGIALGRSLALEDSPDQRRLGIVESLDTALRRAADHPTLAGLALADAARAAHAMGDPAAAGAFESELNARYPGHPAADAINDNPTAQGNAG